MVWSDFKIRILFPLVMFGLSVVALLFNMSGLWVDLEAAPNFFLLILFNALLYRPDTLPLPSLLLLCLLKDCLMGGWMGISFLQTAFLRYLLLTQLRLFSTGSFFLEYLGFMGFSLIDAGLNWGWTSFFCGQMLSLTPYIKGWGFVILLYPITTLIKR